MPNLLYADDGSTRITVVNGTTLCGAYAPDGSLNVIKGIPGTHRGIYHPSGAMLVKIVTDSTSTQVSAYSRDGFRNIVLPPFSTTIVTGAMRCTVVSGSFATTTPLGFVADVELDFANNTYKQGTSYGALLPNISLTRASTATYVNSSGLVDTAPVDTPRLTHELNTGHPLGLLLEKTQDNLLRQSENFSITWTKGVNLTVEDNVATSPAGTLTATKVTLTVGTIGNIIYQQVPCAASTVYTYSIYVKHGTYPVSDFNLAIYDATNGAFINGAISTATANTTNWTRLTYTFTTPVGCVLVRPYALRVTSGSIAADSGNFYIWGAQLETGYQATSYIPTTTVAPVTRAADTGATLSAGAFNSGLKTTATNLCLQSDSYNNGWSITAGITVTPDTTVDPLFTTNADTITSTATANQSIFRTITGVLPSTTYTFSQYVKLGTFLQTEYKFAIFDITNAAFIASDIIPNVILSSALWLRYSYTFTTPANCTTIRVYPFRNSAATSGGDFFLWGSQLELGDIATTYIPTTTTAVTSSAFSQFTSLVEFYSKPTGTTDVGTLFGVAGPIPSINDTIYMTHATNATATVTVGGASQLTGFSGTTVMDFVYNKAALAFAFNNCAFSVNGAAVVTDVTVNEPTGPMSQAIIGSSPWDLTNNVANTIIAKVSFWDHRRSDSDIVAITV